MKRFLYLITILLCIFHLNSYSQELNGDAAFERLFKQTLEKFASDSTSDKYVKCVAELKRIDKMYPKKWIVCYHISLFEIQQSLSTLTEDNTLLLDDAKIYIDQIKQIKDADLSEVYTLEGYYYYTLIAIAPQQNGSVYYKNVLENYSKALKYNKNNPRAKLLLLTFKMNMAGFMGQKEENICNQLHEIYELFQNDPENLLRPSWGKNTLHLMIKKNCIVDPNFEIISDNYTNISQNSCM